MSLKKEEIFIAEDYKIIQRIYIAYVAYPIDLIEEGFTPIVANVFGFKALRTLRLEDNIHTFNLQTN